MVVESRGRPVDFDNSRTMPTVLAVGAEGVCWKFFLMYIFLFSFSLSMGNGARCILKYCLKGSLYHQPKFNYQILMCNDKNYGNTSFAVERNLLIWKRCDISRSTTSFLLYSQPSC